MYMNIKFVQVHAAYTVDMNMCTQYMTCEEDVLYSRSISIASLLEDPEL